MSLYLYLNKGKFLFNEYQSFWREFLIFSFCLLYFTLCQFLLFSMNLSIVPSKYLYFKTDCKDTNFIYYKAIFLTFFRKFLLLELPEMIVVFICECKSTTTLQFNQIYFVKFLLNRIYMSKTLYLTKKTNLYSSALNVLLWTCFVKRRQRYNLFWFKQGFLM